MSPELAGPHQQQPNTVRAAVVDHSSPLNLPKNYAGKNTLPLILRQFLPYGKAIFKFQSIPAPSGCGANLRQAGSTQTRRHMADLPLESASLNIIVICRKNNSIAPICCQARGIYISFLTVSPFLRVFKPSCRAILYFHVVRGRGRACCHQENHRTLWRNDFDRASPFHILFLTITAIGVASRYRTVKITKKPIYASRNTYKILKPKCSNTE